MYCSRSQDSIILVEVQSLRSLQGPLQPHPILTNLVTGIVRSEGVHRGFVTPRSLLNLRGLKDSWVFLSTTCGSCHTPWSSKDLYLMLKSPNSVLLQAKGRKTRNRVKSRKVDLWFPNPKTRLNTVIELALGRHFSLSYLNDLSLNLYLSVCVIPRPMFTEARDFLHYVSAKRQWVLFGRIRRK